MSAFSCDDFRAEAARRLAERGGPATTAFEAHWLDCAGCRGHVERAEALERLLDASEDPRPASDLAARVLSALAPARTASLGRVDGRETLDADERALDRLLELVPPAQAPVDLARTLLMRLAPERSAPARFRQRRVRRVLALAAAAAIAALALWSWWRKAGPSHEVAVEDEASRFSGTMDLEEDDELLAYALERWELLTDGDVDLWLASLDPTDEALLESAGAALLAADDDADARGPGAEGKD